MIADLAQPRQVAWPSDEHEQLTDVAIIWAAVNVLDELDLSGENVALVREARSGFLARLRELDLSQTDLFEHLADAVERDDWAALGLPRPPD